MKTNKTLKDIQESLTKFESVAQGNSIDFESFGCKMVVKALTGSHSLGLDAKGTYSVFYKNKDELTSADKDKIVKTIKPICDKFDKELISALKALGFSM